MVAEDEPQYAVGGKSTKWPTPEETRLRKATTKVAQGAVALRMGKPVGMAAGTEVVLSDQGFGLSVEKAGDNVNFPKKGDRLTMHYVGSLKNDGTVFDSSRARGQPFEFTIGKGQVITGWDQGVITMSLGERAILHVPSYKGYGDRGVGAIPPNADLDFDVELLAINGHAAPGVELPTEAPKVAETMKSGASRMSAMFAGVVALAACA